MEVLFILGISWMSIENDQATSFLVYKIQSFVQRIFALFHLWYSRIFVVSVVISVPWEWGSYRVPGKGKTPFPTERLLQGSEPGILGWCWVLSCWSCQQCSVISFFLPVCVVYVRCVHLWAHVYKCTQPWKAVWGPEEDTGIFSKTLPYSLRTQPLTQPEAHCFWLHWLASEIPGSPVSVLQLWVQVCMTKPSFYVSTENLNLCPHACVAVLLSSGLSP